MTILQGQQISHNYPYGSLRCTITFDIEFKKGKGFRFVTQTVNPKTGRTNAPKTSTYAHFAWLYSDEKGHIHHGEINVFGYNDVLKFITFLNANPTYIFTPEQSKELYTWILSALNANIKYTVLKDGEQATRDAFLTATKFKTILGLYNNGASVFELTNIGFNPLEIESFKA